MVRITDIQDDAILWQQVPYCDIEECDIPKYLLKRGDLLFARTGGTVGKSYLVPDLFGESIFAGYLIRTRCAKSLSPKYAKRFMESSLYWKQLRKDVIATAQPNCNGQKLGEMIVPLPPLAEQNRIVTKIEELFAEVENVAAAKNGISRTAERINKKVLDLAIRGQLVPQNPNDEPATELLKRIADTRRKTETERSRTAAKGESTIFRAADRSAYETRNGKTICIDDEIPFEIPDSWAWCRLRDLGDFVGGHTPSLADKSNWENGTILWVTSKDMKQKYIHDTGNKVSNKGAEELQLLPPGSLLMVTRSGILRRTFPIAIAAKPLTINQDQRALRFHVQGMEEYIYCVLKGLESIILRDYRKTGTTVESIIWEKFIDIFIPIPPLAEQKRIVAKIEEVRGVVGLITRT